MVIAQRLGRKALEELAAVAKPDTLLAWYRKLIADKFDGSRFRQRVGRLRIDEEAERLVLRMAKENPSWGYDRIVEEWRPTRAMSGWNSKHEMQPWRSGDSWEAADTCCMTATRSFLRHFVNWSNREVSERFACQRGARTWIRLRALGEKPKWTANIPIRVSVCLSIIMEFRQIDRSWESETNRLAYKP
jgi:hypothetical protein